jgi:hypothetical protein
MSHTEQRRAWVITRLLGGEVTVAPRRARRHRHTSLRRLAKLGGAAQPAQATRTGSRSRCNRVPRKGLLLETDRSRRDWLQRGRASRFGATSEM